MSVVAVIGAGLFGQIIAKELMMQGHAVTLLDSCERNAGSGPAACLMKPSWFSSLGRDIYDPALELLDINYGVEELQFRVGPTKMGGVMWVQPKKILSLHATDTKVEKIICRSNYVILTNKDGAFGTYSSVVVAAGVWSNKLVPVENLTGRAGVAFTWRVPREEIVEPFISPWAPYRQLVGFKRGSEELWVGDGSSIKPENWTDERTRRCHDRCSGTVDRPTGAIALYGVRPYVRGHKPCYLRRMNPRLWVATGGAKNGTLAAAHCALTISRRIK